jgi:hypothetical protein
MNVQAYFRAIALLGLAAILGGCAVGQTIPYSSQSIALQGVSSAGTVAVAVHDMRPYVLSGNKPEKFVGLMRGGFGNPFDVTTASGAPLAGEMRDALVASLKKRGITATSVTPPPGDPARAKAMLADTNARRRILVTLREWKSDSMMNTSLIYDVQLEVLDGRTTLATASIRGDDNIGSVGLSPAPSVTENFVKRFDRLFDHEKVRAALK